jgi:hypothetical protein
MPGDTTTTAFFLHHDANRFYRTPAGGAYASTNTRLYATAVHLAAVAALTVTSPDHGFDYGDAGVGAAITARSLCRSPAEASRSANAANGRSALADQQPL